MTALDNTRAMNHSCPLDFRAPPLQQVERQIGTLAARAASLPDVARTNVRLLPPGLIAEWSRSLSDACQKARVLLYPASPDGGWTQSSMTETPSSCITAIENARIKLTDFERDYVVDSVVSSEAIEGVHLSREQVSRLLDQVLRESLPDIG